MSDALKEKYLYKEKYKNYLLSKKIKIEWQWIFFYYILKMSYIFRLTKKYYKIYIN